MYNKYMLQMLRDPSGIFQLFNNDNKDPLTRNLQRIGKFSFTVALIAAILAGVFNSFVVTHKSLEFIVGVCGGGGFFLGTFMFIGVGARVTGQQQGVNSFGGQIFRVLWKTFLYFLLPAFIVTVILVLFVHPKS